VFKLNFCINSFSKTARERDRRIGSKKTPIHQNHLPRHQTKNPKQLTLFGSISAYLTQSGPTKKKEKKARAPCKRARIAETTPSLTKSTKNYTKRSLNLNFNLHRQWIFQIKYVKNEISHTKCNMFIMKHYIINNSLLLKIAKKVAIYMD
jgi:hypothetical protein